MLDAFASGRETLSICEVPVDLDDVAKLYVCDLVEPLHLEAGSDHCDIHLVGDGGKPALLVGEMDDKSELENTAAIRRKGKKDKTE